MTIQLTNSNIGPANTLARLALDTHFRESLRVSEEGQWVLTKNTQRKRGWGRDDGLGKEAGWGALSPVAHEKGSNPLAPRAEMVRFCLNFRTD